MTTPLTPPTLLTRWQDLFSPYLSEKQAQEYWSELEKHYTGKKRYYHNFDHIAAFFKWFDQFENKLEKPLAIAWSIFYHDAIYDVNKKNNEEKSAELAVKRLESSKKLAEKVNSELMNGLILSTKNHTPASGINIFDAQFMIDADLSILGASPDIYKTYCQAVRKEYSIYPDLLYKPGRKKVLESFLARPRIYQSEEFHHLLEEQARKNLEWEIKNG